MAMGSDDSVDVSTASLTEDGSTNVKIQSAGSGAVNIAIPRGRRIQVSLELDASGEIIRFGAIPSTIAEGDEDASQELSQQSIPVSYHSSNETVPPGQSEEISFSSSNYRTPPSSPPQVLGMLNQPNINARLPLQPRLQKNTENVVSVGSDGPLMLPASPKKQILPVIPSLRTNSTHDLSLSTPGDSLRTPPHNAQKDVFADRGTTPPLLVNEYNNKALEPEETENVVEIAPQAQAPFVMQTTERCDSMSSFGMKSHIVRDADIFRQPEEIIPPPTSTAIVSKTSPKKKTHTLTTKILTTQAVIVKPEKSVDTRAAAAAAGMGDCHDRSNERYELLGRVVDFVEPSASYGDTISTTSSVTESHALHTGHTGSCPHCACNVNAHSCQSTVKTSNMREEPDMVSDIVDLLARTCVAKASRSVRKLGVLQPYHSIGAIKNNGRRIKSSSSGRQGQAGDDFTVVSSSYAWRG